MKQAVFTGVCPALVTPFCADGAVNYDKFAELVDRQICGGVSAICVCGTTGENPTLTAKEQQKLVSICVKHANGRVKVIAGAGSNDTAHALELSQGAKDAGADAILIVTPYYNKTTQEGLIKHFTYIADRVALPMILYNVPPRTGISIKAPTYAALAEHPNIVGVKEASGDLNLVIHTRDLCPADFHLWSGNDDQVVSMMALGAEGVISVAANIMPEAMVELAQFCMQGDFKAASRLQTRYCTLLDALFMETNPIPVKAAMNLMGMEVGSLRLPLCDLKEQYLARLKAVLQEYCLLP